MGYKETIKTSRYPIILITLVFTIVAVFTIVQVNIIMRAGMNKSAVELLNAADSHIENTMREPKSALIVASHAIHAIWEENKGTEELYPRLLDFIMAVSRNFYDDMKVMTSFSGIYGVLDGVYLDGLNWLPPETFVPQERLWYTGAVAAHGEIAISPPYRDAQMGNVVFSYSVEMYEETQDGSKRDIGVLAIDSTLSNISDMVVKMKLTDDGYGIMLDGNYNILCASKLQQIGKNYFEINPGVQSQLLDSHIFMTAEFYNEDGLKCVGNYKRLENGWIVGLITPTKSYFHDITQMTAILIAVFLLATIILCAFVARNAAQKLLVEGEKWEAIAASEAKSKFLAMMSHEIRTPMNAILGISQIQLRDHELTNKQRVRMEKIFNSGSSLLGIINDILDLSKIEKGRLELSPVEYDVPSLINDTVALNMVRIGNKPIDFVLNVDKNIPQRLIGDELRVKQILNNILSNAFKYTDRGTVTFTANFATIEGKEGQEDTTCLEFEIADTGSGMTQKDLAKLFDEYNQISNMSNYATESSGLGMSITKMLVEMMDGHLNVESEFGKGTKFKVQIKQAHMTDTEVIGEELVRQLRAFTYSETKQKYLDVVHGKMDGFSVLIVDDVETNIYVAQGLMEPYGLKVDSASGGAEMLNKLEKGNIYDIIFLDHMMPKMDGLEACDKARQMGYTGTIIALTANAVVGQDKIFLANGFDGFLSKPIDIRELHNTLLKYIDIEIEEYEMKKIQSASPSPQILEAFNRDAKKAVVTLDEAVRDRDLKLFTTTAHAMKSALANIGEKELSVLALKLEDAGRENDMEYIKNNAQALIDALKALIYEERVEEDLSDINEDRTLLEEQLKIVSEACRNYDEIRAISAIDMLLEKQWQGKTKKFLNDLRNTISLDSEFEIAVELADKFIKGEV